MNLMKSKDIFWAIVEAGLWYYFIYTFLFALKNPVDLYQTTGILLVTAYLASFACPLIRNSSAWRRTWGQE